MREASARGAAELRGKPLPAEQVEQRRRTARERNYGQRLRGGARTVRPLWTAGELALLGTIPDEEAAKQIGRGVEGVRQKRTKLGVPTARDRRRKGEGAGTRQMKRACYTPANLLGGAVIVLLLIDPTRPLAPVLVLLALSVVFAVLPRFLPR